VQNYRYQINITKASLTLTQNIMVVQLNNKKRFKYIQNFYFLT